MNRFFLVACIGWACAEPPAPPQITIDVSPVNLGVHLADDPESTYHFDLQLTNLGDETLTIAAVRFRGDLNCAFTFEGPDRTALGGSESAFLRGWYLPVVVGTDQIAMEVDSDATNFPTLVVPICGKAVAEGSEDETLPVCELPPDYQPDCTPAG